MGEEELLKMKLGNAIRIERERNGLTQIALSEHAEIHYNYIGQLERGEKSITVIKLVKICKVFGIPIGDFLNSLDF